MGPGPYPVVMNFKHATVQNPQITLPASRLCLIVLSLFLGGQGSRATFAAETAGGAQSVPTPKRVIVPKLQGPLKIDAERTESVWAKAAVLHPFLRNNDGSRERESTEVRLWYDDQALYMFWTCMDGDIQATFKERDSKFWEEEVAEFFITPKDLARYFELQWNPLGGVFDAMIKNNLDEKGISKSINGDWSFTAKGMRSAVKVKGTVNQSHDRDELWQVEVRIPFADLGQSAPKPGEVWRANFYRFNRDQRHPVELLCWTPTWLPSFHQPSRFGYLEFGSE